MMPLTALALTGCLAVNAASDRIRAGDLAAAISGFTAPAPEALVALAPAPGVQRIFRVPELRRLAMRLAWPVEPDADICMERPVSPPDPARLLEAMRLTLPDLRVTLLEFSRQALPEGVIEFPLTGLRAGRGATLWSGYVVYAGTRHYPLWARVQVLSTLPRVVAAEDLRPGQAVSSRQLKMEMHAEVPRLGRFLQSVDEAVGQWPRLPIRAGTVLRADMIQSPRDIQRGETVRVDVRNGAAHIELEAQAEAAGSVGESIAVRNPVTHKRFLAKVEGKGRVSVDAAKVNP